MYIGVYLYSVDCADAYGLEFTSTYIRSLMVRGLFNWPDSIRREDALRAARRCMPSGMEAASRQQRSKIDRALKLYDYLLHTSRLELSGVRQPRNLHVHGIEFSVPA